MGVGNAVTGRRTRPEAAESYIVRVYRRGDEPGHEVAGLVERVEQGGATAFTGRDELWAALTVHPHKGPAGRVRRSPEPGRG